MACAKEVHRVSEESYVVKPSTKECAAAAVELHNMNSTSSHKGENSKPENLSSVREREETPKSVCNSSDGKKMKVLRPSTSSNKEGTPVVTNQRVEELQAHTLLGPPSSPISPRRFTTPKKGSSGFSQESPLNIPTIESTPKAGWPTDLSQPIPKGPFHITTPETPYGQVIKPNSSPETRKNWKKWIDNFPDFEKEKLPTRKRRNSTPLSELKRRCWDKIMKKDVSTKADGEAGNNPDANRIQDSMTENRCQLPSTSSSVLPRMDSTEKSKHDNDRQVGIQKQLADPPEPVENKNVSYDLEAIDKDSQGLVECMDPLEMRELEKETEKEEQKSVKKQFKFMISGIQVKRWKTINEPTLVSFGYCGPLSLTPRILTPGHGQYLAMHTLILAHARAYRLYDREFRNTQNAYTAWFEPKSDSEEDKVATERAIQSCIGWVLHPIHCGDYPPLLKDWFAKKSKEEGYYRSRLPEFSKEEIEFVKGIYLCRYVGLNYYTTFKASAGIHGKGYPVHELDLELSHDPTWSLAGSSIWLAETPWNFRKLLNWVAKEYDNPPTMITENGCPDNEELHDSRRINFYTKYLKSLLEAIHEDGCHVFGFLAWSLMDNFEWSQGYSARFGLHHVDFENPKRTRTPKDSAHFFKYIASAKQLPESTSTEQYRKKSEDDIQSKSIATMSSTLL